MTLHILQLTTVSFQLPDWGPDRRITATPLRPGPELSAAMVSRASAAASAWLASDGALVAQLVVYSKLAAWVRLTVGVLVVLGTAVGRHAANCVHEGQGVLIRVQAAI